MERPHIVVAGNVVADIVARPVGEVPRHRSLHPESITFHPGGGAGNVAIVLARLGVRASLLSCVGRDPMGEALRGAYAAEGVLVDGLTVIDDAPTGISVVLVDEAGERRFIASPGAGRRLRPAAISDARLDGAFALHIGGFFSAPGLEDGTLAERLAAARAQGVLTSLDPSGGSARERRAALFPLLPHLDLLLLNLDEGEKLTDEREPAAILAALRGLGAHTVILKQATAGALMTGAQGRVDLPAYPASPVDSTGAGDSFAGALLAALARGDGMDEALRWAAAAGAATVESLGATGQWQGWSDLQAVRERGG